MPKNSYYLTNTHRRNLLGHISFGVSSHTISKKFYDATFLALSITVIFEDPVRKILGYGPDANTEVVNIFERGDEAHAPGAGTHIAFNAPSRKAVNAWYKAGIENGGRGNGEPGVRENYGRNYYSAFLIDPDGWRVEAVFQDGIGEDEDVIP
jgi:hypothetical protein